MKQRFQLIITFLVVVLAIAAAYFDDSLFIFHSKLPSTIVHEQNNAYFTNLPKNLFEPFSVPTFLYEDGHLLSSGGTLHKDIRSLGKGRYSFWNSSVYFSTSDNTNPLTNGRAYEIGFPVTIPLAARLSIIGIAFLLLFKQRKVLTSLSHVLFLITLAFAILVLFFPIIPFFWSKVDISPGDIRKEDSSLYTVRLPDSSLASNEHLYAATLMENGEPLKYANSLHDDIRKLGNGRYSFWNSSLYFSSSDNSNPLENGRRYQILRHPPLPLMVYVFAYSLAGFFFYLFLKKKRQEEGILTFPTQKNILILSCLCVAIAFLIPRLPFYIDYQKPFMNADTYQYLMPAGQILTGQLPTFLTRTLGYPLFLTLSLAISKSIFNITVVQAILTLASSLFFLFAFYCTFKKFVYLAALAMVARVSIPILFSFDFSIATESVYVSLILLFISFLLLAISKKRGSFFLLSSLFAGLAILVRPAGIFLLAYVPLVFLYSINNKVPLRNLLFFVLPMPLLLILSMSYNYAIGDSFRLTRLVGLVPFVITSSYWETDANFPASVNEKITNYKNIFSPDERQILKTSWDPRKLYDIFYKSEVQAGYVYDFPEITNWISTTQYSNIFKNIQHPDYILSIISPKLPKPCPQNLCSPPEKPFVSPLAEKIYQKALVSHPELYLKWVWTMAYTFFENHPDYWLAYNNIMDATLTSTPLERLHSGFLRIIASQFMSAHWLVLYLVVLIMSFHAIARSRMKDTEAFVIFCILLIHLLAGITAALSNATMKRYPGATLYIVYLALPFGCILLSRYTIIQNCCRILAPILPAKLRRTLPSYAPIKSQ